MNADDPDGRWAEEPPDRRRRRLRSRLGTGPLGRLDRPRKIVLRDFVVYEVKLLLDGAKSFAITWAALGAVALDMIAPGERPGRRFYAVMRLGERLDRWLSLYGIAEAAEADEDGMFGVSRAGSPTLLGHLESFVHRAVVGEAGDLQDNVAPGPRPDASGTPAAQAWPRPAEDVSGEPALSPYVRAERATRLASDLFDRALAALDRGMDALDTDREAGEEEPAPDRPESAAGAAGPGAKPESGASSSVDAGPAPPSGLETSPPQSS